MFIIFAIPFGAAVMQDQLLLNIQIDASSFPRSAVLKPVTWKSIIMKDINSPNALEAVRNEDRRKPLCGVKTPYRCIKLLIHIQHNSYIYCICYLNKTLILKQCILHC